MKLNTQKFFFRGAAIFVGVVFVLFAGSFFWNAYFTSQTPIQDGPEGLSGASAAQSVSGFADSAGTFAPQPAPTPTVDVQPSQRRVTQTTAPETGLSQAEEQLLRDALERQAERQARLDERAWEAANAPLGQSIHDPYAGAKQRRARGARAQDNALRSDDGAQDWAARLSQPRRSVVPEPARTSDLAAGTYIAARLMVDIRSELPGLTRAIVTNDVFDSQTMQRVIIPRGAQLLGSYDNQTTSGQRRLFVYWTEMRFPDGRVFKLERSSAVDATGASGVTGRRQTGFLTALLQGALLGTVQNLVQGPQSEVTDLQSAARIATGQSVGSVAERYMEQQLAKGPRFTVKAGTVVNVVLDRPFTLDGGLERQGALPAQKVTPSIPRLATASATTATASPTTATPLRYDRTLYGDWDDADNDCQNTRHEVLEALSTGQIQKTNDGCAVIRGRWLDPYTGQIERVARELDVDHLVPLAWAHPRGGYLWDGSTKRAFANDTRNLFATKASVNREKGARSPLEWLPPNESFHCEYVTRFERIVRIWSLEYRRGEAAAMNALRAGACA